MGDTGYVQSNIAVSGRWPGWSGFLLCGIIPVEWEIHLWTDALASGIRSNTKQVLLSQSEQNIRSTSIIAHDFTKGNGKNCNCLPFYICLCIIIAAFIPPPKRDGGDSAYFMIKCWTPEKNKRKNKRGGVSWYPTAFIFVRWYTGKSFFIVGYFLAPSEPMVYPSMVVFTAIVPSV